MVKRVDLSGWSCCRKLLDVEIRSWLHDCEREWLATRRVSEKHLNRLEENCRYGEAAMKR